METTTLLKAKYEVKRIHSGPRMYHSKPSTFEIIHYQNPPIYTGLRIKLSRGKLNQETDEKLREINCTTILQKNI